MTSGRHLFICRAGGAHRAVNTLSKCCERLQDSDPIGCQRGAPVRTLTRHCACERHTENTLGAPDVLPGVAIRPSDITGGQCERPALTNRAQQMQAAVTHDEVAVLLDPHLRLGLNGYDWLFLLISVLVVPTLRHTSILLQRRGG